MKTIYIGKKINILKFNVKNGKRPKCSMCYDKILWDETGIKIISSQMTGHLAFHQDCLDKFLGEIAAIRDALR